MKPFQKKRRDNRQHIVFRNYACIMNAAFHNAEPRELEELLRLARNILRRIASRGNGVVRKRGINNASVFKSEHHIFIYYDFLVGGVTQKNIIKPLCPERAELVRHRVHNARRLFRFSNNIYIAFAESKLKLVRRENVQRRFPRINSRENGCQQSVKRAVISVAYIGIVLFGIVAHNDQPF